jgi:AIG2-like family
VRYFAYGSNLNVAQMAQRCPGAKPLGRIKLPGWKLVFRGVADAIQEPGAFCYGGVWRITPEDEAALDTHEGVRHGLYRKEYIPIEPMPDGEDCVLIYTTNSTGIFPPSESYLECIKQGYRDFKMPRNARRALLQAVKDAWDNKNPSYVERQRYRRKGRPKLAARPDVNTDPEPRAG